MRMAFFLERIEAFLKDVLVSFSELEILGKRDSQLRNHLRLNGLWVCLWGIFFIDS